MLNAVEESTVADCQWAYLAVNPGILDDSGQILLL
jgi:hypothetical protein